MDVIQVYFLIGLFAGRSPIYGQYLTLEACNEGIVEKYNGDSFIDNWICTPGMQRIAPTKTTRQTERDRPWRWSNTESGTCYGDDVFCGRFK